MTSCWVPDGAYVTSLQCALQVYDSLESRTSPLDFICSGGRSVLEFAKPEHVTCSRLLSNEHSAQITERPIPQLQQISRPVRGSVQGSAESLKPAELEWALEWLGGLSSDIPGEASQCPVHPPAVIADHKTVS